MALSFSDAKKIPITEYLSSLGFEAAKITGNDCWYHSPFRRDRCPSFKVNIKRNIWYDHGAGEGGTIIDLGAKLHQCTMMEFLEILSRKNYHAISASSQSPKVLESIDRKLEIVNVRDLSNEDLINYLRSRQIKIQFAYEYCKEVEFTIACKAYLAVGFQNRSGGYELRNRWFKGSSSPKDISIINNRCESLSVTEGFMDFLSLLTLNQQRIIELPVNSDFLILNSLSFLNKNLSIFEEHKRNILFLDNDQAGKKAKESLALKGICLTDASSLYAQSKDVNEFLKDHSARSTTFSRSKGNRI